MLPETVSLIFSKFHFPELPRLDLALLLLNTSPTELQCLFCTDPGAKGGDSKQVGKEGVRVFHVSYNQFLSGISAGTA